jgi:hypothetical protein
MFKEYIFNELRPKTKQLKSIAQHAQPKILFRFTPQNFGRVPEPVVGHLLGKYK